MTAGRPTKFDANFHPNDFLAKKKEGWTNAEIAAAWEIGIAVFYDWIKKFPEKYDQGVTAAEGWLDRQERQHALTPNPNQSPQIFKSLRSRLAYRKIPGFAQASVIEKAYMIDKLLQEGIYSVEKWASAMDGLSKHVLKIIDDEKFKEEVRSVLKNKGK